MLQEAIITKIREDGLAEVVVERSGICGGNCSECDACRYDNLMKTLVRNPIGAHRGQHVYIEMPTVGVLKGAVFIYVLPLVMLFAAYFVAALLGAGEGVCIASAFGGAILGVVIAALLSKKQHGKNPTPAEVVSVIDDQEEL